MLSDITRSGVDASGVCVKQAQPLRDIGECEEFCLGLADIGCSGRVDKLPQCSELDDGIPVLQEPVNKTGEVSLGQCACGIIGYSLRLHV